MHSVQLKVLACWFLVLPLLVAGCGPAVNASEAAAIAKIRKLGGKVEFDETHSDRPVTKVYLHATAVSDADLAELIKLTKLKNLFLGKTKISDAGLEHLKGMTRLETLSLNSTEITDAGLPALSSLTGLKTLNLQETKTTAAGIDVLRRQLPVTSIAR